jgi:hypothetical protein
MPGGRPRIYKSVAKLEKDCESFFELCAEEGVRPTITGLALHLGFADKTTLYEYRDRPEFSYPIKKSLLLIEKCLELKLENQAVTGIIFALKNMGWKDKVETGFTDKDGNDVKPMVQLVPAPNCEPIKPAE